MQTVTQDKLDTLTEEHHKEVCEQKETTDNTFGDKVSKEHMISGKALIEMIHRQIISKLLRK